MKIRATILLGATIVVSGASDHGYLRRDSRELTPEGVEGQVMHVKIAPGANANDLEYLGSVTPLFTLPYERLKELSGIKPGLPDLTLWYSITTNSTDAGAPVEAEFTSQGFDDTIITDVVIPVIMPPPQNTGASVTPDFVANQNYLRSNDVTGNNGIDAEYSWSFPGGNGAGITIYDVESNWNQNHEDLVAANVKLLLNAGDENDPSFNNSHGTAVLGEMVGTNNGLGVKGISYGAAIGLAPQRTKNLGLNRGNAMLLAVNDAKPGDVILLEMQTSACGLGDKDYGPAEEHQDVFDVTTVAVAKGIVVVAAAGNGNVNLDDPRCMGKYNRAVRDSGAIIVGAGGSGRAGCTSARTKKSFSTYGSRVDVQGWGDCVWTTSHGNGYKDPANTSDENRWYRRNFSGTSSASPFVAAAAANIQGIAINEFGSPLAPSDVRQLLVETGLPQQGDTTQKIGPLVNLRAAIDKLLQKSSQPIINKSKSPKKGKAKKTKKTKCAKSTICV